MPNASVADLSPLDRRLLTVIQSGFPLDEQPFAVLGTQLGLREVEVIERLARLQTDGYIRQISAIFDSGALGYATSLVAAALPPERVDAAAAIVNQHPGVSHNYHRPHRFNLWFTLAVPAGRDLQAEVAALGRLMDAEACYPLPTLRRFKIGVRFDLEGGDTATPADGTSQSAPQPTAWTPAAREAVRALQTHLPLTSRPFDVLAPTGLSGAQLVSFAKGFLASGAMRRFGAVLHHRRVGFTANGMGIWHVADGDVEQVGLTMASFAEVSHCYQRPTWPDWPYNLFTMVHGTSEDACRAILQRIAEATGQSEYDVLFSDREYKKTRVRYFTEDDDFEVSVLGE